MGGKKAGEAGAISDFLNGFPIEFLSGDLAGSIRNPPFPFLPFPADRKVIAAGWGREQGIVRLAGKLQQIIENIENIENIETASGH